MRKRAEFHVSWAVDSVDRNDPQVLALEAQFESILRIISIDIPPAMRNILGFFHPRLEKQFRYVRLIERLIAAAEGAAYEYVLIPFIDDYCLAPLAVLSSPFCGLPWGGIIIRPRFHLGILGYAPGRRIDFVERVLYARLFRTGTTLQEVFAIDPFFVNFMCDPRLRYIPDPAEMNTSALTKGDRTSVDTILVYGHLDERKGIPELLRAIADPRVPKNIKLLFVGVQNEFVRSLLNQAFPNALRQEGRLREWDRVVTEAEEIEAFRAAEVVWTFYPGNYGPSGVLVRAGQASKPVICTQAGYCGRVVTETGMGIAVPEGDLGGLVNALVHLFSNENVRRSMGRAGRDHFSKFTPARFADPIVEAIVKRSEHVSKTFGNATGH
jgi:glycosyltransferase involved in cell wall biosynthesis